MLFYISFIVLYLIAVFVLYSFCYPTDKSLWCRFRYCVSVFLPIWNLIVLVWFLIVLAQQFHKHNRK